MRQFAVVGSLIDISFMMFYFTRKNRAFLENFEIEIEIRNIKMPINVCLMEVLTKLLNQSRKSFFFTLFLWNCQNDGDNAGNKKYMGMFHVSHTNKLFQ